VLQECVIGTHGSILPPEPLSVHTHLGFAGGQA
jgi:hypothetical protein